MEARTTLHLRAQGLALASHGDLTALESLESTLLIEEARKRLFCFVS